MTTAVLAPLAAARPADGGAPARRAVVRWAWRLFRREWRQQFLILALITVAVAATIVGSAVATNNPPPKNSGFGTAQDSVSFSTYDAHTASVIASLERRFGRVEVIENETLSIPGSINTYQLRAQDPHGPFSGPMLSLVSGHFPSDADQVAVTSGVASAFHLRLGATWRVGGVERQVVGIVENPQSLLDEFALVAPGQVTSPAGVTALFDAPGVALSSIGNHVQTPASVAQSNPLNPETISLAALVLGMLLIALVSIGGFTVLAQRRLRSIGMLESTGATDRHVRLVVSANGTVVGVVGAILGFALGLVVWLAYRPSLEQSSHHVIGVLALSWTVVIAAMVLAVVAAYFAASRPARAITKVPIVQALSGRPAPPRQIHRSALPGIVFLVVAFLLARLLRWHEPRQRRRRYTGAPLRARPPHSRADPACTVLPVVGRASRSSCADRDPARAARSGPVSGALGLGAGGDQRRRARRGDRDAGRGIAVWQRPRLRGPEPGLQPARAPRQHAASAGFDRRLTGRPAPTSKEPRRAATAATPQQLAAHAKAIAKGLGAQLIALETPNAQLSGTQGGRNWSGSIYVATPQLLRAFGITSSEIDPNADILTSRPGLSGVSGLVFNYVSGAKSGPGGGQSCTAATGCVAHPVIQEIGALPSGTSAPNTVVTEHAMKEFHIEANTTDWLVQGTQPFTAAQISNAELAASTTQLSVESKNDQPSSSSVVNWATIFGIVIALGVLGMSVGLVRSETAGDLRTLAATGASSYTRRTLTAVTAGALGFLGALLGTVGGYIGMIGWLRSNSLNGGIAALGNVPVSDLLLILLGMPAFAAIVGWLFAGREPAAMAHQAIE